MIFDPNKITMAYRCAACGKTIYGMTGALALSGDMIRLKCDCGESAMTIKNTPDAKIRVSVPCVFCQKEHEFIISKKLLFSKELFAYPCPYSGLDIVFFGKEDEVEKSVADSDKSLSELLTDEEREALEAMENGEYIESDEHIRDMIILVLGELADDKKIFCECGTPEKLNVDNADDYVEISCAKCGCKKRFYCTNDLQTSELFDAEKITLTK